MDTIPLTIITGFLGAGKTTLLNRLLHADHGLRVAVLVNDFGAVNIDSQLVVGVDGDTVSLANGCICCTIRGDLINATLGLLNRPEPPQYLIVETSGVSDPLEVALTFKAMKRIRLDSVLTVLDAEQILTLEREFAVLALNQVGMADIVILNKVDLVTEPQLEKVRAYIRSIIPKSRIIETMHANVPLELILNVGQFDVQRLASRAPQEVHVHAEGEHHEHEHTDHSLIFETWSWQSDQPLSTKALKRMVDSLPETIYRAKGIFYFVESPDQRGVLQVVGQRASLTFDEPWGNETPHSQLVVIGAHGGIDAHELQQRMDACLAVNAPKSEVERVANAALDWLRRSFKTTHP